MVLCVKEKPTGTDPPKCIGDIGQIQMNRIKSNLKRTVPVMAGYIVLGIGYGIVLDSHGYGIVWAFVTSALIYAGSMQFMAVNLLSAGAGIITTALTTVMVNARHLFYGISMIDKYKDTHKYKPYLIFALTDETYSLVCNDDTLDEKDYFQISLFDHIYWVAGSCLGALIGEALPFDFTGVDFALTALFVCIVTEQWLTNRDHIPAIIGILASVICLVIFGRDNFLIPSMITITIALGILKAVRGKKNDE